MLLTSFNWRSQSLIGFCRLRRKLFFGGNDWFCGVWRGEGVVVDYDLISYPARKGEGEALIYIGGWVGGGGCWLNIISSKAYLVLFLFYLQWKQIIRELSHQRKRNFHYWFHAALIVGGDEKAHRRHPFLGPPARERRKTKQRKTNNNYSCFTFCSRGLFKRDSLCAPSVTYSLLIFEFWNYFAEQKYKQQLSDEI